MCICKSNLLQTLDLHKWIWWWMLKIHHIKGTVSEMFHFPIILWVHRRSQCVHLRSPLYSICDHRAFSMRSQSVYFALTFVQCSLIVQSNNIIFRLITIHTVFFFITDETQCKDNSWDTPNKLFILRSHNIHILFMVHSLCVHYSFVFVFALCVCSSFTVHMHSLLAQSALTVGSECTHRSLRMGSPLTHRTTAQVGK